MSDGGDAIVLFAHGARDPAWAQPFQAIRGMLAQRLPGTRVELAFLELMSPRLAEAVATLAAEGVRSITLAPLFMAQGGHLREDLPRLLADLRGLHPEVDIRVTSAVGDVPEILQAIADWVEREHGR